MTCAACRRECSKGISVANAVRPRRKGEKTAPPPAIACSPRCARKYGARARGEM